MAQQWIVAESKAGRASNRREITHQDMIDWYQCPLARNSSSRRKARWEELMVSFAQHPNHDEAYAVLARAGQPRARSGRRWPTWPARRPTASRPSEGGQRDWTHKDSLEFKSESRTQSSICRSGNSARSWSPQNGFHIVRVVERQEVDRRPAFSWTLKRGQGEDREGAVGQEAARVRRGTSGQVSHLDGLRRFHAAARPGRGPVFGAVTANRQFTILAPAMNLPSRGLS